MKYIPNKFPLKERMRNTLLSVVFIVYGGYGIYNNDLFLPTRRGAGGTHLHDEPALLMYAAIICGCLVMLSVIVDHYDERNNEYKYKAFAKVFKFLAGIVFIASFLFQIASK